MDERIQTQHPEGKQGVRISRAKYDTVRAAILRHLAHGPMTFAALSDAVDRELSGSFDGSVRWYVTTVKLDLEARGEIARVAGRAPQELHIVGEPQ